MQIDRPFITDEQLSALTDALPVTEGMGQVRLKTEIAWYLRERDTRKALRLAAEVREQLQGLDAHGLAHEMVLLRVDLLDAYAHWLFAELQLASTQCASLLDRAYVLGAVDVVTDVHLLRAELLNDLGQREQSRDEFDTAAAVAAGAGDDLRMEFAQLAVAISSVRLASAAARQQWRDHVESVLAQHLHPALDLMACEFLAFDAYSRSESGAVLRYCNRIAGELAHAGLLRRRVTAMITMAVVFNGLNDNLQALEWLHRAHDCAAPTAWPFLVGNTLLPMVTILRRLGRLDQAANTMTRASHAVKPLAGTRTEGIALQYQAELQLEQGLLSEALDTANALTSAQRDGRDRDLIINILHIKSQVLSAMGRADEALDTAQRSLQLALELGIPLQISESHERLAELHRLYPTLPLPPGVAAERVVLHYLLASLNSMGAPDGQDMPPAHLDAVASEYAKLGQFGEAYHYARLASAGRERIHSQDVSNRMLTLEARFEAERNQAEAAHLRQLAQASAERAELLTQTAATLEQLGAIGQEITGHLQEDTVYDTLSRHMVSLLRMNHFSIYRLNDATRSLDLGYGIENQQRIPAFSIPLDHPKAQSVRCALSRSEILLDIDPASQHLALAPGTHYTSSAMFVPLIANQRLLGVMSVQSDQPHAYAERERLIFRTLCAYGAIALDNADNYRKLESTQAQLVATHEALTQAYASLEDISLTDPLTGLRNRRFLEQHLDAEVGLTQRQFARWQQSGEPDVPQDADLLFFLVDVDHFKRVNDTWGHPAGDKVLIQMRERLQLVFRESDYLVRWGGEEFLVVARSTSRDQATQLAERIRVTVAGMPFDTGCSEPIDMSCSIGFAALPFMPTDAERLRWQDVLRLADQALYIAKRSGRNAWVGCQATADTPLVDDPRQLMDHLAACVALGRLSLVSNRAQLSLS